LDVFLQLSVAVVETGVAVIVGKKIMCHAVILTKRAGYEQIAS
jgi:hypothetical protein